MPQKMKRIGIFFFLLTLLLIVSACALPLENLFDKDLVIVTPEVIEDTTQSPFQNIGCIWKSDNEAVCNQGSIPQKMGCDTLSKPSEFLGLLSPDRAFMICSYRADLNRQNDEQNIKRLWDSGCKIPWKQRLLVYTNGDYLLISDQEDLKYYFAPLTSSDQALGYALAATGFFPRFDLEGLDGFRIFAEPLQTTNVQSTPNGYELSLFGQQLCGCGPHPTYMHKLEVTQSGDVKILESIPAFEDPAEDSLCVD